MVPEAINGGKSGRPAAALRYRVPRVLAYMYATSAPLLKKTETWHPQLSLAHSLLLPRPLRHMHTSEHARHGRRTSQPRHPLPCVTLSLS